LINNYTKFDRELSAKMRELMEFRGFFSLACDEGVKFKKYIHIYIPVRWIEMRMQRKMKGCMKVVIEVSN